MQVQALPEHKWLQQMVGEWSIESECLMGPDQPPIKTTGSERVRPMGEVWVLCEGEAQSPEGKPMTNLFTFGYDPQRRRFVGSFICSVMTMLWLYDGELDATGKVLTLNSEGPSFAVEGATAKYQDIITIINDRERMLTSRMLGEDGQWTQFMTARYRRK